MRTTTVFMAMSLDGYIAREDGDIDWLSIVESKDTDYGFQKFYSDVDTVVLGRNSYEKACSFDEFPYENKEVIVITSHPVEKRKSVKSYRGDLIVLWNKLNDMPGREIYVDGGGILVSELIDLGLVDRLIISVIPIILGNGIPLFHKTNSDYPVHLENVLTFDTGLVQMHYRFNK